MTGTVATAEADSRVVARPRLLDRLKGGDPNWWLVAALAGTFVVVFAPLVYRRHANFSSFSLDMGIFDQTVWLLAHGETFITVRGLEFFGHHASPALFLLAPFYWLGAGAHFLNFVQILSMAAGAVPVFLLARDRLGRGWVPVALVAVYLLHPALGFMAWELFHPEVMAITPLMLAWWFASRQRWTWYTVSLLYAVAWKEDVALAVIVLGVVLALKGERRVGLVTAGAAFAWFVLVTRVLLPVVSGETFYGQLYQGIGQTPGGIISGAIDDPGNITGRLVNGEARSYLWQLFAPFGFFPLVAPASLLAVPQLLANLLSDYVWTREIRVHYAALPIAGLTLGAVEGVAWVGRRLKAVPLLVGALVAVAVLGTVTWGISPIGRQYDQGFWGYDAARLEVKRTALEIVPGDESVSASYLLVPHLAHRRKVYEFPNPWRSQTWGVRGEKPHDPAGVRWIVVDRRTVTSEHLGIVERLVDDGEFQVRFNQTDMLVLQRVRPPSGSEGAAGRLAPS